MGKQSEGEGEDEWGWKWIRKAMSKYGEKDDMIFYREKWEEAQGSLIVVFWEVMRKGSDLTISLVEKNNFCILTNGDLTECNARGVMWCLEK